MNDVNNTYKTVICLFKFNAQIVLFQCSFGGKIVDVVLILGSVSKAETNVSNQCGNSQSVG